MSAAVPGTPPVAGRVLVVRLSSLGDLVHTFPAMQDLRRARPGLQIDWVVEHGFAPLVRRCAGVARVIESDLRRWRQALLSGATWPRAWSELHALRAALRAQPYDAVLDLQGLTKSALVARLAALAPGGRRYALGNRTDGAGYEPPTRWLADIAVPVAPRTHVVMRSRLMCAAVFGYALPDSEQYGLQVENPSTPDAIEMTAPARGRVICAHGASRADKHWPVACWVELGRRLDAAGWLVTLPHGCAEEERRSREIASALPRAEVLPRLPLDVLVDALAGSAGVVGVDSGLSHIAVALGLPHVQIYNHDTAWRTGPATAAHQCSVYGQPTPTVEAVWRTWQRIATTP